MRKVICSLILIQIIIYGGNSAVLRCLNDKKQSTDWWSAIKFPNKVQTDQGKVFAYLDYIMERDAVKSSQNLDSKNTYFKVFTTPFDQVNTSPFANTLNQLNDIIDDSTNTLMALAFNDDPPVGTPLARAHAKGVIAYEKKGKTGIYLGHSIPEWPHFNDKTGKVDPKLEDSQNIYGQSLFCMSLNKDQIELIADQLYYTKPQVYYTFQVDQSILPKMHIISQDYTLSSANKKPFYILNLQTAINNIEFQFISKHMNVNDVDMIEHGLVEMLQCDLISETWGRPLDEGVCTFKTSSNKSFYSKTINTISFLSPDDNTTQIDYKETQDHSKWAMCHSKEVVCIGDMNKMSSQRNRGGSFACFTSKVMHKSFKNMEGTLNPLINCNCAFQCSTGKCEGEPSNCLECKADRTSKPTCQCPTHFFDDQSSVNCRECEKKCASCKDTPSNCTECTVGRINFPQCDCADGYYQSQIDKSNCDKCDSQCSTCKYVKLNCLTCTENRVNPPYCYCKEGFTEDSNKICQKAISGDISRQIVNNLNITDSENLVYLKPSLTFTLQGEVQNSIEGFKINPCQETTLKVDKMFGTNQIQSIKWIIIQENSGEDYSNIQQKLDAFNNQNFVKLEKNLLEENKSYSVGALFTTQENYNGISIQSLVAGSCKYKGSNDIQILSLPTLIILTLFSILFLQINL